MDKIDIKIDQTKAGIAPTPTTLEDCCRCILLMRLEFLEHRTRIQFLEDVIQGIETAVQETLAIDQEEEEKK